MMPIYWLLNRNYLNYWGKDNINVYMVCPIREYMSVFFETGDISIDSFHFGEAQHIGGAIFTQESR